MKINKDLIKKIFNIVVYIFAIWGFTLTVVFFAMKLGLTKAGGVIDNQSSYFQNLFNESKNGKDERKFVAQKNWSSIVSLSEWQTVKSGILKDKDLINKVSKETGVDQRIIITPLVVEQLRLMTSEREVFKKYFQPLSILGSQTQFSLGIFGIKEKTAKQIEINLKDKNSSYYLGKDFENILDYKNSSSSILVYADTLEVVKDSNITKNSSSTNSTTSSSANISASTTNNSIATTSDISVRKTILLTGSDAERINRLTNSKDHYYSYLYAAIYMKELMTSWKKAGFDISNRPEILATLYNIGFEHSSPNANPEVGGAEIDLNGQKYSFGSIGFYFYFSDELTDVFSK